MSIKNILRIIFLVLLVGFIIYSIKHNFFTYENINEVKKFILSWNLLGPVVIVILFIIFNIFAFPTFFFIIISGYLYGLYYGFLVGWIGMAIGIASSFLNTRYLFRQDFNTKFGDKKIVAYLEKLIKKYHGWGVIFLRIFFIVPYNIQNITFGLTSIGTFKYISCSALGVIPITIFFTYLGSLLSVERLNIKDISNIWGWVLLSVTIASTLFFMIIHIIKKIRQKEGLK